jgi:hypothetical protein
MLHGKRGPKDGNFPEVSRVLDQIIQARERSRLKDERHARLTKERALKKKAEQEAREKRQLYILFATLVVLALVLQYLYLSN